MYILQVIQRALSFTVAQKHCLDIPSHCPRDNLISKSLGKSCECHPCLCTCSLASCQFSLSPAPRMRLTCGSSNPSVARMPVPLCALPPQPVPHTAPSQAGPHLPVVTLFTCKTAHYPPTPLLPPSFLIETYSSPSLLPTPLWVDTDSTRGALG